MLKWISHWVMIYHSDLFLIVLNFTLSSVASSHHVFLGGVEDKEEMGNAPLLPLHTGT